MATKKRKNRNKKYILSVIATVAVLALIYLFSYFLKQSINSISQEQVRCDIALVPVGGTYTMDTKRAAELVNIIRPEYAIPIHYGSIVGKKTDGQTFASLVDSTIKVVEKIQYFE